MSGNRGRIGVYPGTFDPITVGHTDIIGRATRVVDHLIVGVATNAGKGPLFSPEDRAEMVRAEAEALEVNHGATIEVRTFDNLLMQFCEDAGASMIRESIS